LEFRNRFLNKDRRRFMGDGSPHESAMQRVLSASHPPLPWTGTGQLPWHEQEFSERMLAIHLDPETHMASRTPDVITKHLDWLSAQVHQRGGGGTHVLDVGCGPGLYCHQWAERGHLSTGFDFAPAPLAWAQKHNDEAGLKARFFKSDLTNLPDNFEELAGKPDAITLWFGEFHSFQPAVAGKFLKRLANCLPKGGLFVLEYQPWDIFVHEDSNEWTPCAESIFCDKPHLWLQEFAWNEEAAVEVHVHWIIEQESGNLHRYEQCHQAWREDDLVATLAQAGLGDPVFYEPITGVSEEFEFPMLVTKKLA
jgi:SAM-dependent methyltransferase